MAAAADLTWRLRAQKTQRQKCCSIIAYIFINGQNQLTAIK